MYLTYYVHLVGIKINDFSKCSRHRPRKVPKSEFFYTNVQGFLEGVFWNSLWLATSYAECRSTSTCRMHERVRIISSIHIIRICKKNATNFINSR